MLVVEAPTAESEQRDEHAVAVDEKLNEADENHLVAKLKDMQTELEKLSQYGGGFDAQGRAVAYQRTCQSRSQT